MTKSAEKYCRYNFCLFRGGLCLHIPSTLENWCSGVTIDFIFISYASNKIDLAIYIIMQRRRLLLDVACILLLNLAQTSLCNRHSETRSVCLKSAKQRPDKKGQGSLVEHLPTR